MLRQRDGHELKHPAWSETFCEAPPGREQLHEHPPPRAAPHRGMQRIPAYYFSQIQFQWQCVPFLSQTHCGTMRLHPGGAIGGYGSEGHPSAFAGKDQAASTTTATATSLLITTPVAPILRKV